MIKLTNSKNVGGISDNKAFTLIELLAIIVILAIIAVITIPIILNVIENSRKGAAIDSAYGYKDAISKYYVSEMIDKQDLKLDGSYKVTKDGFLTREGTEYKISTSGTAPSGGWISMENNKTTYGCLTIGDYKVQINDEDITATKGVCPSEPEFVMPDIPGRYDEDEEVTYHNTEWIEANLIYYDPTGGTTGKKCTVTEYNDNEHKLEKTGCMRWYAYSSFEDKEGNIYVNMILDHNTTEEIEWVSETTYNEAKDYETIESTYGIKYPNNSVPSTSWESNGITAKGPLTLLAQLYSDTNEWKVPTRNDEYTPVENDHSNYTINYKKYRARLMKAEEIAKAMNVSDWTLFVSWSIDVDEWIDPSKSKPGYWTSSSSKYISYPWSVDYGGMDTSLANDNKVGVRPVITVAAYEIF